MKLRRLLALLLFLFTSACYSLAEDVTPPPGYEYVPAPPTQDIMYYPLVPPDPVAGQVIYVEKCQPCHGEYGLGDGPDANNLPNPVAPIGAPELARQSYPGEWFRILTEGRIERFMPPFTSLSERQRWDVLAYVYTLSAPAESLARGEELFQAHCANCHGPAGLGDGVEAANFAESMPSFGDQLLMSERSKADLFEGMAHPNQPDLPDSAADLSESERWALADYLRSLTFAPPPEAAAATNPLALPGLDGETPAASEDPAAPGEEELSGAEPGSAAAPAGQGVITGQVVNLSGSELPGDLQVILHAFDQFQETISYTTGIDSAGMFRFEGVDLPEGRALIVSVDYKNTTYTSDLAVVEPGVMEYALPVSVYETTTDPAGLVVERLHVLFEFLSEEHVRVAELVIVSNLSDRVVVPGEGDAPALRFSLPAGAGNLQFQDGALGQDFVITEEGFGDLRAVHPGQGRHQVLFSFDLPYRRGLELVQAFQLPVRSVVVLLPDVGVKMEGDALVSSGMQDFEGLTYEIFSSEGFPENEPLTLRLSGRARLSGAGWFNLAATTGAELALGLGALGVTSLLAGIWLFRRAQTARSNGEEWDAVEDGAEGDPLPEGLDAEGLMDAIIALDDHFKAGQLPLEAYHQRRALLKEQLKKKLAEGKRS